MLAVLEVELGMLCILCANGMMARTRGNSGHCISMPHRTYTAWMDGWMDVWIDGWLDGWCVVRRFNDTWPTHSGMYDVYCVALSILCIHPIPQFGANITFYIATLAMPFSLSNETKRNEMKRYRRRA